MSRLIIHMLIEYTTLPARCDAAAAAAAAAHHHHHHAAAMMNSLSNNFK
jgi:hypothetical protein